MIQVKENDLQSMDWYKEKEEDTQSMWLNFLNDSKSIIFQICFNVSLIINITQYFIVFPYLKNGYENEWKKMNIEPIHLSLIVSDE